jgi:methylenetetrahydrofolate dehydrogenase (NADP+)/methenyltetrahydrofolate cyclohydrolase
MRIDGKTIAQKIFDNLQKKVAELKLRGIEPQLVIILVGEDPASVAYVKQKELKATKIGIKVTVVRFDANVTRSKLLDRIKRLNSDAEVHGIIVQRPLPDQIDGDIISKAIDIKKDVDAFLPNSPYTMPLAAAVVEILRNIHSQAEENTSFEKWLKEKNVVVIGKGETGGGPTINLLKKMGVQAYIVDSKSQNPSKLTQNADIIICAVGRKGIVTKDMIKNGVILVAVGMFRGDDGKLHGDYEEENIKDVASFYTPIPGGVGPVNVAMLLGNVVTASQG